MQKQNVLQKGSKTITTASLVQMALMIAVTCTATMVIKVPTFLGVGYVHLGDSMVFLAAILFGRKKGAITAAIGMSLADFLLGYAYYIPFTFVIKAIMAYIVATIAFRRNYEGKNILNNIFGFAVGGAWMVFGYFLAKIVIVQYIVVKASSFNESLMIAVASIQGDLAQAILGLIIAVPLVRALQGKLKIYQ